MLDQVRETYGIIITQSVGSGHSLRSTPCPRVFNGFLNETYSLGLYTRSKAIRRHHCDESGLQKAVSMVRERADIVKRAFFCNPPTGIGNQHQGIAEELLGHADVSMTEIYSTDSKPI